MSINSKKQIAYIGNNKSIESSKTLRIIAEKLIGEYGDEVWSKHILSTLNVAATSKILYLDDIYKRILDTPGVICEFGVQWGTSLTQLINLRSIYEPFNHSRKIYGFDTFSGFKNIHQLDGNNVKENDLFTTENYEKTLEEILNLIESYPPLSHIKKFDLIKGDACSSIDQWLDKNPHTIISLAIFDMDLYQPTKVVLEKIKSRLTKGSIVVFDELNCDKFPGETLALNEVFGLNNIKLNKNRYHPFGAWMVFGE